MGNQQDVMNNYAMKELKNIYSTYDGWRITPLKTGSGYDTLVRLDRMDAGHRDIVKVLISFSGHASSDMVDELSKKESPGDGSVPRYGAAIILPAHADTAAFPTGIPIYSMNSFEFKGKELSWNKKKAVKETDAAPKKGA